MATFETTLRAELDAINAKIASILANGDTFNWKVGQVSIDNTAQLKTLYESRDKAWQALQKMCPTEVIQDVVLGTDIFGDELVDIDA